MRSYRRTLAGHHHPIEEFRYVHAARKVVGVGSVGMRCYILLLLGRDRRDPLFLQVKEANASVLEPYLGPSRYSNHGQRVVDGRTVMQAVNDIFLGWQRVRGLDGVTRDYYVRQFHDWKGGAEVERLEVRGAHLYGRLCAATPARAHARSGGPHRDRVLPGWRRRVRPRDDRLRGVVRRPEPARLRDPSRDSSTWVDIASSCSARVRGARRWCSSMAWVAHRRTGRRR
jgi:hypothetical protein